MPHLREKQNAAIFNINLGKTSPDKYLTIESHKKEFAVYSKSH